MTDFIADMNASIAKHEKELASQPRKGMMVYLDKSTPILVQYASAESFNQAKSMTSRKKVKAVLNIFLFKRFSCSLKPF